MRDRTPTKVLENGAIRYGVYDESGALLRYEYIRPEDEPAEEGTPLNKATLLQDSTAVDLGLGEYDNPTVDDAFECTALGLASVFGAYASDIYLYIAGVHPYLSANPFNDYFALRYKIMNKTPFARDITLSGEAETITVYDGGET